MPSPTTHHLRSLALLVTVLLLAAALPSVAAHGGDDEPWPQDRWPASSQDDRHPANETGEDRDPERSYTLAVLVSSRTDDGPAPASGAKVLVYKLQRHHDDDRHRGPHTTENIQAEPVARGETDDRGLVTFELSPGHYGLRVHHEAGDGHKVLKLDQDRRVHVHVGEDDRRGQPGPFNLGIAAYQRTDQRPAPAANASVEIYRYSRNATTANATWQLVETGTTDERGHYTTSLPKGFYLVEVSDGELTAKKRIPLNHDRWTRALLQEHDDGDGPSITAASPTVHPLPADAMEKLDERHKLWIRMKS